MGDLTDIDRDFSAIIGQEAWRLSRIHGSMFFMEIGEAQVSSYKRNGESREFSHGKWHFMFNMVQWRFENSNEIVVACEDEQDSIDRHFAQMALGRIKNASVSKIGNDLVIGFDTGTVLRTFSHTAAQEDWDQWTFYCPDGLYWSANGKNVLTTGHSSEPRQEATR